MNKFRIGYFGDGPWAHKAFDKLLLDDTLEVSFVCARNRMPDPILRMKSHENKIPFFHHENINSNDFFEKISKFECELFVSMSFNQIFKKNIINLPKFKAINCHAGKLPFYRGRNVLNWALINDEKEFGITVHFIDEGIDTGDIIVQKCYPIDDLDDYSTLLESAYVGCADCLYSAIKGIQSGKFSLIKQSIIDPLGFYCTARKTGDEYINWNQTSRSIFNFVRAISRPGPEAKTIFAGREFKINKVEYIPAANSYIGIVGSVIGIEPNSFLVKSADTYIRVIEWSDYVTPKIGDRFK